MGSVLQFAVFLSIGWLIRGAVTHPNQDEDKILNNKQSDRNGPGVEDFYFDEQKANDDNVKTGRAISQSAWSKEDKEQAQTVENKTGTQFSDEFSLKNALSYFLNVLHELKKDILGIKEMTHLKNTKDLTYSKENSENKAKQNKMGESNDTPKPDTSTKNTQLEKENQKRKSDYVVDYYKNNGNKFVDDDLETSSDESDDSSHNLKEGTSIHEISKIKHDACISDCSEVKRKPNKYSSEAEETTETKILEENYKKFDDTKDDKKDYFKESSKKSSTMKLINSKTSKEETKNTPSSKTGICSKKRNNSNNLNEKNGPTKKLLNSAEYVTSRSSQDENFNKEQSKRPNQNKTNDKLPKRTSSLSDSRSSEKYSKNKTGSDIYSNSGILGQSTTLSSQSSNDAIYPENIENKPYASEISSEKPTYKKEQKQITSLKPDDQEQARNNAKPLKNNDKTNEYSTVSLQSHEVESEIIYHEMSTDIEIKGSPKEYKGKRLNVHSSHTTIAYSENEPDSKSDGQQTSNSFDTGITISPTTSGNNMNTKNLRKDPSDYLDGKKGTNESEKSNHSQRGKNDSETQIFSETEQTKTQNLNSDSEPEKSLKYNKLIDTNGENNNKEEGGNLTSMTANDIPSPQDSNREIQNHDVEGSDKPQEEAQKNKESLNKKYEVRDTSLDQEYEEDNEDFEISDEFADVDDEDIEMDGDFNENEENNDEMNPDSTAPVLRSESQISQHAGYVLEENSQEQYNTFLEYFYKHSNSPFFQSLKNQSNNFSP